MELLGCNFVILLIILICLSMEVSVKGEYVQPLNITYLCDQSSETVVNLSAYNLPCDELNASINNKRVIASNSFYTPIINSTPGKNFTIRGCHTIEYICNWSDKSGFREKHLTIIAIKNHINNTDEGIKDSGDNLTYGIENHKNNTNEGKMSSRNHFLPGLPGGLVIFIVLLLVMVANSEKIKCCFRSCYQHVKSRRLQEVV
ncbi:uncharacterized protein [Mobula birostris]|uniref:uncharacterized protein n=1 Tax=Mobula birostris TaxID=1983395 RepID=UPI003B28AAC4